MTTISIDRTDGLSSAVAIKGPCRVATTANITLSGQQTIDGVAVVADDRVLVKNQTTASQNGVYVADTGDWRRAKDFSRNNDVLAGSLIYIVAGSTYAGYFYVLTTVDPTIDTTNLVFAQVSLGAVQLTSPTMTAPVVQMEDNGAAVGPVLDLYRISNSPAASDIIGQLIFYGRDSAGNKEEYGSIDVTIDDPTSGSEDSTMNFWNKIAGVRTRNMSLRASILTLISDDAGATLEPIIDLYRNSASPAANDVIGGFRWYGEDSAGNTENYARMQVTIADPTSGSEDAFMSLAVEIAGTLTNCMHIGANAAGTATANAIGLPRGQISFPAAQNASADANTLDDYEEGSWTPAPLFNGSATGVDGTFTGIYNTTGNSVEVGAVITHTNNGTGVGAATLSGLPFTSAGGVGMALAFDTLSGFSGLTAGVCGSISSGVSVINLRGPSTTGGATLTDTNVTDTATYRVAGNYFKA